MSVEVSQVSEASGFAILNLDGRDANANADPDESYFSDGSRDSDDDDGYTTGLKLAELDIGTPAGSPAGSHAGTPVGSHTGTPAGSHAGATGSHAGTPDTPTTPPRARTPTFAEETIMDPFGQNYDPDYKDFIHQKGLDVDQIVKMYQIFSTHLQPQSSFLRSRSNSNLQNRTRNRSRTRHRVWRYDASDDDFESDFASEFDHRNYTWSPPPPRQKLYPKYDETQSQIVKEINALYGLNDEFDEMSHSTLGHKAVDTNEAQYLASQKVDPLYGEILLYGALTAGKPGCLDLATASTVYDFGSGCGKLLLLLYHAFPNIRTLIGYEFSLSRCNLALSAFLKYPKIRLVEAESGADSKKFVDAEGRVIILKNMSIFDIRDEELLQGERFFINVNFVGEMKQAMKPLLARLNPGSRVLSYMDFDSFPSLQKISFNEPIKTSWTSTSDGHHFNYYRVLTEEGRCSVLPPSAQTPEATDPFGSVRVPPELGEGHWAEPSVYPIG